MRLALARRPPNGVTGTGCGEPTALAEIFGDHMVVNGLIRPKDARGAAPFTGCIC